MFQGISGNIIFLDNVTFNFVLVKRIIQSHVYIGTSSLSSQQQNKTKAPICFWPQTGHLYPLKGNKKMFNIVCISSFLNIWLFKKLRLTESHSAGELFENKPLVMVNWPGLHRPEYPAVGRRIQTQVTFLLEPPFEEDWFGVDQVSDGWFSHIFVLQASASTSNTTVIYSLLLVVAFKQRNKEQIKKERCRKKKKNKSQNLLSSTEWSHYCHQLSGTKQ